MSPDEEKMTKKKLHAIDELLQTERDYVQDLSHLVEVCLQTLSKQQWIDNHHKSIIIRNASDILLFHKQFIITFHPVAHHWSMIAKAFLDQISHFSLYKQYCGLQNEACQLVSFYRNRPEWNQFLKECLDTQDEEIMQKRLHLEDYLIKPVQRICRYQLLIKEIIRYTSPQTPEYDLWTAVLSEMQDIVAEIDDLKFQREMKERTDKFIERLDGDWRINRRHVSQLGNLLIAGAIEVTYSALGQSVSKPRYLGCFVFPTYIIMVRPKKVTNYEPKHWFPLKMAEFENLEDIEGQRENSFIVRCKKHTFIFNATCAHEKQLWAKKIQEAIVTAKMDSTGNDDWLAQEQIVPSLPGLITKKQSIRASRSFTNVLDMALTTGSDKQKSFDRQILRRSISTNVCLEDLKTPPFEVPALPHNRNLNVSLVKRYSADYVINQKKPLELKPRNNSETYVKPDPFAGNSIPRRRPSSLDLLSDTSNMIGKMSFQFKNNHQNALRINVDHKLRDVCTQEYLSSRAWHVRDNYGFEPLPPVNTAADPLKKKKSSSLLRSSVSSLSIIIPKRASEPAPLRSATSVVAQSSDCDIKSTDESACSSLMDRPDSLRTNNRMSYVPSSRKSSIQSQPAKSFDCTLNDISPISTKKKKRPLAERVLKRITSIRHIKSHTAEWNMSGDTLKSGISEETKTYPPEHESAVSLKSVNQQQTEETESVITAFAYASTPAKKKTSWKTRLRQSRLFFIQDV
ncbi:hypothetical protein G6F71_003610 [Rhizopus microsporus]|nr:hypothetical protein G6F71_003610 [Rhizopus microsporus]